MGAKHRMAPQDSGQPGKSLVRERFPRYAQLLGTSYSALLCAGSVAILGVLAPEPPADNGVAAAQAAPGAPQPVSQEGTLIAVSADSVTARSPDGYTQTYRVTPGTTVITGRGSRPAVATSQLAVNEQVDIVGTTQGGTALATTVAHRDMGHGDAPPMDYAEGQAP